MRILVLGGDGMLGHQLLMLLRERHEVRVTLRQEFAAYANLPLFSLQNSFNGVDVRVSDRLLAQVRERGVTPVPVDVSEFLKKGGGSVKCMIGDLGVVREQATSQ